MFHQLLQAFNSIKHMFLRAGKRGCMPRRALFLLIAILIASFVQIPSYQYKAYAADLKVEYTCTPYTIRFGDTLGNISARFHIGILALAKANNIFNINLIFAHRSLCLPHSATGSIRQNYARHTPGILSSGSVRWYAYNALERSNYRQVHTLLHHAAAFYGLSPNIVIAIARQESNFQQHIIARDGGIGVMQLMPSTATWINTITGTERDPYKLRDNIFMGAFYIRMLGDTFHWNTSRVISAYNEGPWAVSHRGIRNWSYVNNVLRLAED